MYYGCRWGEQRGELRRDSDVRTKRAAGGADDRVPSPPVGPVTHPEAYQVLVLGDLDAKVVGPLEPNSARRDRLLGAGAAAAPAELRLAVIVVDERHLIAAPLAAPVPILDLERADAAVSLVQKLEQLPQFAQR